MKGRCLVLLSRILMQDFAQLSYDFEEKIGWTSKNQHLGKAFKAYNKFLSSMNIKIEWT